MTAARFFKCLGDETRLRCLLLLGARPALCVCDIAAALAVSQPKISRHLAQLRACDLVTDHRDGQWVFYRLHPALEAWQHQVLAATAGAQAGTAPYRQDLERLQATERCSTASRCPPVPD